MFLINVFAANFERARFNAVCYKPQASIEVTGAFLSRPNRNQNLLEREVFRGFMQKTGHEFFRYAFTAMRSSYVHPINSAFMPLFLT